jgi:hypothetical protein
MDQSLVKIFSKLLTKVNTETANWCNYLLWNFWRISVLNKHLFLKICIQLKFISEVDSGCLHIYKEYESGEKQEAGNISSFLDCQSHCEQDSKCNFWTWTLPSHVNRSKCFHFDANDVSLIQNSSAISGHKFCKGKSYKWWVGFNERNG